ncbi:unnamed protein product [Peniophora sp. CBMAI 1063]|nr:unnamed protein product [Peniophora sp. CBMAI 1063]
MSSSDIPIQLQTAAIHDAQISLPAALIGSFLLGIFTLLVAFSAYIFWHKGLRTRTHVAMLVLMLIMYGFAATAWGIRVASLVQAVGHPGKYAILDAQSVGMESQILLVCESLNIVLGDVIVVWRTWTLWSDKFRAKRIVGGIPCILILGTIGCGVYEFVSEDRNVTSTKYSTAAGFDDYNAPDPVYETWPGKTSAILSGILNVWCEVFVVVVTWHLGNMRKSVGRHRYDSRTGMALLLLSLCGAIYCIFWIYWVVDSISNTGPNLNATLLLGNNAAAVQVNGIYPTFVMVSASLQQVNTVSSDEATPSSPTRRDPHVISAALHFDVISQDTSSSSEP